MSRAHVSWCCLLLGACADPVLSLQFQAEDADRRATATARLRVLAPPVAAPFGCEDLAFDRVDPDLVALAEVSRAELGMEDQVPVAALDRRSPRIFLAEGYSSDGVKLIVGCAGLAAVERDQVLNLVAEPVTTLRTELQELAPTFGSATMVPIPIQVSQALGRGVPQAPVRVETFGPGTDPTALAAIADSNGALRVEAPLPPRPGPFAVDLLSRWPAAGRVRVSGFQAPTPAMARLPGAAYSAAVGRIGPRGPAVATLIGRLSGWTVELYDADSFTAATEAVPFRSVPIRGAPVLAVVELPEEDHDRVVVVSSSSVGVEFLRLDPDDAVFTRTLSRPAGAGNARRILSAGPCDVGPAQIGVVYDGGFLAYYDLDGEPLGSESGVSTEYSAAGCVSDQEGVQHRVFLRGSASGSTIVEVVQGSGPRLTLEWLAPALGLSFAPKLAGQRHLLGAQRQLDQQVLARARLQRTAEGLVLETVAADPVPATPVITAGVDLDADEGLDVIALTARISPEGRPSDYALYGSLGRTREGRAVTGSARLPTADLCNLVSVAGDFDNDAVVDVILAEAGPPILCGRFDLPRAWFYPLGPGAGR